MRQRVDRSRLRAFMRALAEAAPAQGPVQVYFAAIEPELFRFPAIDPRSFRRAVEAVASPLR